jgi:hyperosmotically inducible periplasmic protein
MKKNTISSKILRLFIITMLGTSAFAIAEGKYNQPPSAAGEDRTMSQTARDAWIQGKLEATLAYNEDLSAFDINTEVKNGVVYLKGNVESQTAKDLATQVSQSIEGVSKVENNLRVVPEDSAG